MKISGRLSLQLGSSRESSGSDEIPVAVRAADVSFAPISVPGLSCVCIRGIDGPGLAEGVSGTGSISCAGPMSDVDIMSSLDHNTNDVDASCQNGLLEDGSQDHPHAGVCNGPEELSFSGSGPAGSARLDLRLQSWTIQDGGACTRNCSISQNGPDCLPCTEDDPREGDGNCSRPSSTCG